MRRKNKLEKRARQHARDLAAFDEKGTVVFRHRIKEASLAPS